MRNTRWISLLGRKALRVVLAGGLSFCGWGCHQNYYYYGNPPGIVPGCPPGSTIMPSAVDSRPALRGPRRRHDGQLQLISLDHCQRRTELARGGEHTVEQQSVAVRLETIRS